MIFFVEICGNNWKTKICKIYESSKQESVNLDSHTEHKRTEAVNVNKHFIVKHAQIFKKNYVFFVATIIT